MTRSILDRLRRRWGARWFGLAVAASGLAGFSVAGLLWRVSWPAVPATTAAWTAALVALALLRLSRPPLTRGAVARHLDRWQPEIQESAGLLVADLSDLTPLEQLQRDRITARLSGLDPRSVRPPGKLYRTPLVTTLSAGLLGAALWLWPGAGPAEERRASATDQPPAPAPEITEARLELRPPDYTGIGRSVTTDWELDVPEGSRITWDLATAHDPETVWLQTTDGDSLPLVRAPADPGRFTLSYVPPHSTVYRVIATSGTARGVTGYHRLVVRPDLPPTLTILEPLERVSLGVDDPRLVTLAVAARDDYQVNTPEIVAAVASGYGESVQFRESVRRFALVERVDNTLRLTERIDLDRLGMQPGDELYLYVRARDNREPVANSSRTETVIVAIEDTSTVTVSQPQGLAVDRMPDYFRSQRQIIIDTERLLADRSGIDRQTFADRSQNIGLDQYLLRLRYSELVGDEFEDVPLGLVEEDIEALGIESAAPPEPLPDQPPEQEGEEGEDESDDPSEEFVHDHDDPENATRLAATIKSTLKLALAEMWQAELYLRTRRPEQALPYERRALEILKRVQQAARSYVLRTGFDPPPIDVEQSRLTGDVAEVALRSVRTHRSQATPERDLRLALHVVQRLQIGAPADSAAPAALRAGGRVLARRALGEPLGYLEALGAIGELADSLSARSACTPCLSPALQGLYRALPEAVPQRQDTRPAETGLARDYFDRLTGGP